MKLKRRGRGTGAGEGIGTGAGGGGPGGGPGGGARGGPRGLRAGLPLPGARGLLAGILGIAVALLALRGIVPAGAGVYYDDGVYLALAQSLAEGGGYVYANLPGEIPGVKYPPLYPAVLALGLELAPDYPAGLRVLEALNALFIGLAATLSFLAFAAAWSTGAGRCDGLVRPGVVMPDRDERAALAPAVVPGVLAVAALLSWGSAQTMVLATALLSEPLFLVATFGALLAAGRKGTHPALVGLLAALAFLVRGIGVAVVGAVLLAELLRRGPRIGRRLRRVGLLALGALPPMAAWIAWSGRRAGRVPEALVGQYGSYADWYAAAGEGLTGSIGRLAEIGSAHWGPFLSNLEMLWIPDAGRLTANFVLATLGLVTLVGAFRIARRNLALALFPFLYLLVVLAWPYEPDRFYYVILPALTLMLTIGGLALTERIREDLPRWGGPAVAVVAALLFVNAAAYAVEAHAARAWSVFRVVPAAAYEPLNTWIRENTPEDAVIASGLDPHVYWETGRKAVPSFRFLAADYGRYDPSDETLAADLDEIVETTGARWVAVIRGEGKAGDTMAAFAALHPERSRLAYEAEAAGVTGEVWEVAAEGGVLWERDPLPAP